eukprot:5244771-Amphidinium_carterae.1
MKALTAMCLPFDHKATNGCVTVHGSAIKTGLGSTLLTKSPPFNERLKLYKNTRNTASLLFGPHRYCYTDTDNLTAM